MTIKPLHVPVCVSHKYFKYCEITELLSLLSALTEAETISQNASPEFPMSVSCQE